MVESEGLGSVCALALAGSESFSLVLAGWFCVGLAALPPIATLPPSQCSLLGWSVLVFGFLQPCMQA